MTQTRIHTAQTRLASYGTLAPGEINYHQMDGMVGVWSKGTLRGTVIKAGWGVHVGLPGFVMDPDGPDGFEGEDITFHIFESYDLPDHWARLDEFEGEGYVRTPVMVQTDGGEKECCIYLVDANYTPLAQT